MKEAEKVGLVWFCEVGKKGTTIGRDDRGIAVLPENGKYVEMGGIYLGRLKYLEKEDGKKFAIFDPVYKIGMVPAAVVE